MKVRLLRKTRFFKYNEEDGSLGGSSAFTDVPANTILPAEVESGMYLVRLGEEMAARVWASDAALDLKGGKELPT